MGNYYGLTIVTDQYTWDNVIPNDVKSISDVKYNIEKEMLEELDSGSIKSLSNHPSFTDLYDKNTDDDQRTQFSNLVLTVNINSKVEEFLDYLNYLIKNSERDKSIALAKLRHSIYNNLNLICADTENKLKNISNSKILYNIEDLFYNLEDEENLAVIDIAADTLSYFEMLTYEVENNFMGDKVYIFTSDFPDEMFTEDELEYKLKKLTLNNKEIHIKVIEQIEVFVIE